MSTGDSPTVWGPFRDRKVIWFTPEDFEMIRHYATIMYSFPGLSSVSRHEPIAKGDSHTVWGPLRVSKVIWFSPVDIEMIIPYYDIRVGV